MKVNLEGKLHWSEWLVKGEMTQEMSVDFLGEEQIDPGKLT